MTTKTKDPTVARRCPSPLVLFGIDSRGKPKAAQFGKERASLAMKAATQLQLNVLASSNPKSAEIAARLPVGRVHATGRMFVPFIRHDLYDKLVHHGERKHPFGEPTERVLRGVLVQPRRVGAHLPRNWREIGVGDLVVANQDRDEGWYEAIVDEQSGDMFTLRWRDYPRERRTVHHRLRLGLVYPGPRPTAENGKSTKASGQTKRDKPFAVDPAPTIRCPRTGTRLTSTTSCWPKTTANGGRGGKPSRSRRPVTCSSCAGAESATNVGLIARSRLDLALLCPDAAS